MSKFSCVIAGGGAFGVAAALELCERGHRVTLIEAGALPHPDAASTDISKIVRLDYGADELYTALMERALPRWRKENHLAPLFHEHGFCVLSSAPLEPGTFAGDSYGCLRGRGHPLERLDPGTIARRWPRWRPGRYVDGYFNPRGGFAESGRVIAALAARARAAGAVIRENAPMAGLVESSGRVGGVVLAGGEEIRADLVIVAAGAWTPVLLPHLAPFLTATAQPVLHFLPARPADFVPPDFVPWAADIQERGWYGFPATPDGVVKVANHGTGQAVDPRAERVFPAAARDRFRDFLRDSLPDLADAPVVHERVCLYCDTADGDFLIDRDPDRPGLIVAAGGSGHGFKFTPVLGELIADVAEERSNPYAGRFAWRTAAGPGRKADKARAGS